MDSTAKASLVAAANLLIRSPQAHYLYGLTTSVAPLLARYPELRITGDADPLTELGRLKVNRPEMFDDVVDLVERRREDSGMEPLRSSQRDTEFNKTAYMQEFMEQKRLRQRRAADIENMMRLERDRLVGRTRLDFMQRQSEKWKAERDELMAKAKNAARPKRLTRDEITAVVRQFWAGVDARLDALEAVAKARGGPRPAPTFKELEIALSH